MSTAAIPVHVALVDETGNLGDGGLTKIAGAVNEQVHADFAPVWRVSASVGAYTKAPAGMWQVRVQAQLDEPGALGYHTDVHNQPISFVQYTPDVAVTISHETLEMLADPWGSRLHQARLPEGVEDRFGDFGLRHATSRVHYLLEACDPPEQTSYEVGGVRLSDFLLPAWYRSSGVAGGRYSHAGGCSAPRQVADGGYVSFGVPESGEWFQVFNSAGKLDVQDLGKFGRSGSLREWTDLHAREYRSRESG